MSTVSLQSAIPTELTRSEQDPTPTPQTAPPDPQKVKDYVLQWKRTLKNQRLEKLTVWNECWQLYRGKEDWSDKEEWQAKLVLPKAWSSVKQATNVIKRLLRTAVKAWTIEAVNPDDLVTAMRGSQMTDLTEVFMDNAKWDEEFAEGLECGFIQGLGVWKLWWGLKPRTVTTIQPAQSFDPSTGQPSLTKQIIQEDRLEGQLFIRAVDPYNFYWLPGSKLNRWVGTIEEVEMPKWELTRLANMGMFDPAVVHTIRPFTNGRSPHEEQRGMRFDETRVMGSGPTDDLANIRLTEYWGPLVIEGEIVMERAHIIIANDDVVLLVQENPYWHRKPPYVGFSPLSLPFRTEGMGLIENVREINKALNRLANLSIDTLVYRLLPVFEVVPEFYENAEDFETGLTPGKIFRRNMAQAGAPGITPISFEDISPGAIQVSAQLDRAHQEGALVSEIQQALPRYRGVQTATEIETKAGNQESFFGSMATDIEKQALEPMVEMAMDLIFQYLDTATDPRVASILGVNAAVIQGMGKAELLEMVQGDFKVKVRGLSGQLEKAEMLQNLVQFMNLIGQNPQAWLPYIDQNALLKRIMEAFRPSIHDIDDIVVPAEVAAAREIAQQTKDLTPDMLAMIPQLVQQVAQLKQQQFDNQMAQQQLALQAQAQAQQAQAAKQQQQSKPSE